MSKQTITFTLIALITLVNISYAGLKSPFESQIFGIDIPNTSSLDQDGRILRGMSPLGHIDQLINYGVTDVLIFKNKTRSKDVDKEIIKLKESGYTNNDIHFIPFKWKEHVSLELACEQTIKALSIIREVLRDQNRTLFFHCTVGEDRTGYLSGLYRMLLYDYTVSESFQKEMCSNGFGRGNPKKPRVVVDSIRKDLLPLFLMMAKKIKNAEININNLNYNQCFFSEQFIENFKEEYSEKIEDFKCAPQEI